MWSPTLRVGLHTIRGATRAEGELWAVSGPEGRVGASGGRPHPGTEDWVQVLRDGVAGTQRQVGREVAVKDIDKKQVDSTVRDGLLKESHISHPNILRLCQGIETEDKIFITAEGLNILRGINLIHRDLKPQGIICMRQKFFRSKPSSLTSE
ncbi:hypothetical protein OPV22_004201 [Ensete ventricosum]|uniref:Protein kinase domain-containing protein n=1 Tax=Ensete ventricosum TaxID=4639 RepID=A0AAV8S2R2_ENSVE|nr:hypothetical protein OPV22_004201 [Ensete ventricosum]